MFKTRFYPPAIPDTPPVPPAPKPVWPGSAVPFSVVCRLTKLYYDSKFGARARSVRFNLTRDQYIDFWIQDNRFERREREGLTMARIDKRIGFQWDNIECLTRGEDLARQGRGFTGKRARAIYVGSQRFATVGDAAVAFNVSHQVASYRAKVRMKTDAGEWVYEDVMQREAI